MNDGIKVLGLIKSSIDSQYSYRGENLDSGVSIDQNNKVTLNPQTRTNRNANMQSKSRLFSVIDSFNQHNKSLGQPISLNLYNPNESGSVYGTRLDGTVGEKAYSRAEVNNYMSRMKKVMNGEGSLYSFDIETMGEHPKLSDNLTPQVNKSNYAITEFSLWKSTIDKETGKWNREKVHTFSSSPVDIDINGIMNAKNANQSTHVMLQRLAGYHKEGSIINGEVLSWDSGMDITDTRLLRKGKKNLQENTMYTRSLNPKSSDFHQYKEGFGKLIESLRAIGDDGTSVLTTMNGLGFDLRHILSEAKSFGIDTKGLFEGYHFDNQVLDFQFLEEKKYDLARNLRAKGINVEDNLTLENLGKIAMNSDPEIMKELGEHFGLKEGGSIPHMASYDTFMSMVESIRTYEMLSEDQNLINKMNTPIEINDGVLWESNKRFVAKESSLHFKVSNNIENVYNSSIIPRNGLYKIKASTIDSAEMLDEISKSLGGNGLSDSLVKNDLENLQGKIMLELEDTINSGDKVYMFYNSTDDIQKDLIDGQVLSPVSENDLDRIELIKKSRLEDDLDATRRDIESFTSVSSYKDAETLHSFVRQYNSLQEFEMNGEKLTSDQIQTILKGDSIQIGGNVLNPEDILEDIRMPDYYSIDSEYKITPEKLKTFRDMYSDIELNSSLYGEILSQIDDNDTVDYLSTYSNNPNKYHQKQLQKEKARNKTAAFGNAIRNIEEAALGTYTEEEKLKYIINADDSLKKIYDKNIREAKYNVDFNGDYNKQSLNKAINSSLSNEDKIKIAKDSFKTRFREEFDFNSEISQALLRGKQPLNNKSIATSIDIVSPKDGYTSLTFSNEKSFKEKLRSTMYKINHQSKNEKITKAERASYLNNVTYDLNSRGLLNEKDYEVVKSSDSLRSKVSSISDSLFNNRNEAHNIIMGAISPGESIEGALVQGYPSLKKLYDPNVISNEHYNIVKPFIENRVVRDKYTTNKRMIMGEPISEVARRVSKNEIVNKAIDLNNTGFSVIGNVGMMDSGARKEMISSISEKLNWTPENAMRLEKLMTSREFNQQVDLKGYGKKVGIDKLFIEDAGDIKLVATTNGKYIREQIAKGVPMKDLQENAFVFTLPKVDQIDDIRFISQGDVTKKSVTFDIRAFPNESRDAMKYVKLDTVDEVLDNFSDGFGFIKDFIGDRNYEKANARGRRAWSYINESKSLTGHSTVYRKNSVGQLITDSIYSPNRADFAKQEMINHSTLVYDLDALIDGSPELKSKFDDMFGSVDASSMLNRLKNHKKDILMPYSKKKPISDISELGELGTKLNLFMKEYSQDIATEFLENETLMSNSQEIIKELQDLADMGNIMVNGKESDVSRGFSTKRNLHSIVPFSDLSNLSRNVQWQSANAYNINEESMIVKASTLPNKLVGGNNASELYKSLGVKPGMGVTTPEAYDLAQREIKRGNILGLTVKTQIVSPNDINNKIIDVGENKKTQDSIIKMLKRDHNININYDEIKAIAKRISESSSVYEDGGMIDYALASVLNPSTVTNERIHTVNPNLKIGQGISSHNGGAMLGHDKDGKPVYYTKDKATITNIKDGKVMLQLSDDYGSVKLNIGGSEKAVVSAPNLSGLDDRMKIATSKIQKYIMNGASVAVNPSVVKHMATNTAIIPSINAIGVAIKNKEEALEINNRVKELMPNIDLEFKYDKKRGYVGVHTPRITPYGNVDPYREIANAMEEIKVGEGSLYKRISENLDEVSKGVGFMDVFLGQNNTILRAMTGEGNGKGVSLSTRDLITLGAYREIDSNIKSEYSGTWFPNLLKRELNEIVESNEKIAMQSSNVYAAWTHSYGQELDDIRIKSVKLDDIIPPNGMIEADVLDDIFKMEASDGIKYNLYKLDLSESNIGLSVSNPFYANPTTAEGEDLARLLKYPQKQKLNEIYLPAILANYAGDDVSLSSTQKSMADFVSDLQALTNRKDGDSRSIASIQTSIDAKYKKLIDSYAYDLLDKDGLRLKAQKTKNTPGSFMAQVEKVVAPTFAEDGLLSDYAYGDKITYKDSEGKVKYIKSAFVNQATLENAGLDFEILGRDIIDKQVADKNVQLEFLESFLKDSNYSGIDYEKIKDLPSIQSEISKLDNINHKQLGIKFLEDIGVESVLSRNPNVRTESINGVILKLAHGLQDASVAMDTATALGTKSDTDGDKDNIILRSFSPDEEGNLRINHYEDGVRKDIRLDAYGNSDINLQRVSRESKTVNSNAMAMDIGAYVEEENIRKIVESGESGVFHNETMRTTANTANVSKSAIGQTSNPGLYVKRAADDLIYRLSQTDQDVARKISKSIHIGTVISEQNSLDFKSTAYGKDVAKETQRKLIGALSMGNVLDDLHYVSTSGDKQKVQDALVHAIELLKPYTSSKISSMQMIWEDGLIPSTTDDFNMIAKNIMSGDMTRSGLDNTVTVQEFLSDLLTVFKDEKSHELYLSPLVRQSKGALGGNRHLSTTELPDSLIGISDSARKYSTPQLSVAAAQLNSFTSNEVILGDRVLKNGDMLYLNEFTKNTEPGVYEVKKRKFKNMEHSISLIGEDGEDIVIRGDKTSEIQKKLQTSGAEFISSESLLSDKREQAYFKHVEKLEESVVRNNSAFIQAKHALSNINEPITPKEKALVSVSQKINFDNLEDLHNTIDNLSQRNFLTNEERKNVLKQMNDAIRSKGTKDYQVAKKQALLGQDSLIRNGVTSGTYDKLIIGTEKAVGKDYESIKSLLDSNKRINISNAINSNEVNSVIDSFISDENFNQNQRLLARRKGKDVAASYYKNVDDEIFEKIQSVFVENQYDATFRKDVLEWELEKANELLANNKTAEAIDLLNASKLIHTKDYSGKMLGELTIDQLQDVLKSSGNTGISDDAINANNKIISKLIDLRSTHSDIMIENIQQPITENFQDTIGKSMVKEMNDEIKKKGNAKIKNKSTASQGKGDNVWDTLKTRISGMSNKQKITAGAVATAGFITAMTLGNNIRSGKLNLNRENEDESNFSNKALPQAPPSENKVYVSDNNAINVNVKARSPLNSMADSAERAIAGLFGKQVNVNSNIQDSRERITDREVENLMEKAIR